MLEIIKTKKFSKSIKEIKHKKDVLIELDNVIAVLKTNKNYQRMLYFKV